MSSDAQVLLWIAGVHLLGLACVGVLLIPALRENGPGTVRRQDGEGDDGWGRGPKRPPSPPTPPRGGIPLPDAEQSKIRLREPGRLSELLPPPARRPAREPVRHPERAPHQ